jgi:hypothetical protein
MLDIFASLQSFGRSPISRDCCSIICKIGAIGSAHSLRIRFGRFRSGYSCETQLLTTINDFLQEHDKGHQIDFAILDFSKAFNTVPHNNLTVICK